MFHVLHVLDVDGGTAAGPEVGRLYRLLHVFFRRVEDLLLTVDLALMLDAAFAPVAKALAILIDKKV